MKYLFLFVIFLLSFHFSHTQTVVYDTLITDSYDYTLDDGIEDAQHNTIFVGLKGNWQKKYDIYLTKLNPMGNLLLHKEMNVKIPQVASRLAVGGSCSILTLPANQYLLASTILEPDSIHTQIAFWILDINFNILQYYEQGNLGYFEYFTGIKRDKQNDFIVSYDKECSPSTTNFKVIIAKYDSQFLLKNTFELPGCLQNAGVGYAISKQGILEKSNNKGYYIFRTLFSTGIKEMWNLNNSLQLQKVDSLFNNSTITNNRPNICADWIDKEKQVIMGANSPSPFSLKSDINYLIRDTAGNVLYQDTISYSLSSEMPALGAIGSRLNHDFYLGFTYNFNGVWGSSTLSKYMLLKIDEFGNKKWRATYGDSAAKYVMYKTFSTYDGGVIMAGTRMMYETLTQDTVKRGIYILKVMDNSLKINPPLISEMAYQFFPNPAHNTLNINLLENIQAEISIFDLQGKIILSKAFRKETALDIKDLTQGLYIYRITDEKNRSVNGRWEKR